MNEDNEYVATPIQHDGARYAIASLEETWVTLCYRFFERHGFYDWYLVPRDEAWKEMMIDGEGHISPHMLRIKLYELYESVGIRE